MEKYNKVFGNGGEDIAAAYLKKKKYKIRERNYNIRGGEIDIIAEKGGYVIFVEVKTRSGKGFGSPEEAVTYTKQQRVIKAAQVYMQRLGDVPVRFDVIAVEGHMENGRFRSENIMHIENAF